MQKRPPLHPNPDVAEVLANNRDACRHPSIRTVTRWVGGSPGMIGGQLPVSMWYCPDCKEDVRAWQPAIDDPEMVKFLAKLTAGGPFDLDNG
jgi:hypothetical protein